MKSVQRISWFSMWMAWVRFKHTKTQKKKRTHTVFALFVRRFLMMVSKSANICQDRLRTGTRNMDTNRRLFI